MRWTKINEELPAVNKDVLITYYYYKNNKAVAQGRLRDLKFNTKVKHPSFHDYCGRVIENVISWMPLPEPDNDKVIEVDDE